MTTKLGAEWHICYGVTCAPLPILNPPPTQPHVQTTRPGSDGCLSTWLQPTQVDRTLLGLHHLTKLPLPKLPSFWSVTQDMIREGVWHLSHLLSRGEALRQIKSFACISILSLASPSRDTIFFLQSCPKVYVTRCNPPHAPQYYHLPRPLTLLFSSLPVSLSLSLCLLSPCQSSVQHQYFEEICSTLIFLMEKGAKCKIDTQ